MLHQSQALFRSSHEAAKPKKHQKGTIRWLTKANSIMVWLAMFHTCNIIAKSLSKHASFSWSFPHRPTDTCTVYFCFNIFLEEIDSWLGITKNVDNLTLSMGCCGFFIWNSINQPFLLVLKPLIFNNIMYIYLCLDSHWCTFFFYMTLKILSLCRI